MKMRSSIAAAAVLAAAGAALAQPAIITQWTFNNLPQGTNNNPAPSRGLGTVIPLGMTNNYTYAGGITGSVNACDISSADAGSSDPNGGSIEWRIRGSTPGNGWNNSAPQYTQGGEFDISTVNYSGISFTFDWFSTSQGVHNLAVQYSTNGSNWVNYTGILNNPTNPGVANSLSNGWRNGLTVDLSGIPAVNDNPNFRIRLVSVYDPAYTGPNAPTYTGGNGSSQYNNSSGNWRFDMVTLVGTAIRSVPPAGSGKVDPPAVCSSGGPLTFTVATQQGAGPATDPGSLAVTANLSNLGLSSAQPFYDDATHGDAIAGDGVFTFAATVPSGRPLGSAPVTAIVSDTYTDPNNAGNHIPRNSAAFGVGVILDSGSPNIKGAVVADCGTVSNSRVVISQVFGGGGNLGDIPSHDSPYDTDFVELFNRSANTVDLTGWSLQYAGPVDTSGFANPHDQVFLSGVIQPGQHLLIRMGDPVPGFAPLPTPDFKKPTGFGGMGNDGGRVALVRSNTLIGTACAAHPDVEDLVGYGSAAVCFEGAAPTATTANYLGATRKNTGNQDTNQNFNDFSIAPPTPSNRTSGGFLAGYASSDVSAVCAGSTVTFTVVAVPSSSTTAMTVAADVSQIVGSSSTVQLFDDGTHGDQFPHDNTFTLAYAVPGGAVQGVRTVALTVSDPQGHSDSSLLSLSIGNCTYSTAPVVISQVYGGGGNDNSGFSRDFIEIFNRSAAPVNLRGWSIQYADTTELGGFTNQIVNLSPDLVTNVIMDPGAYRLIVTNDATAHGAPVPTPDYIASPFFGMDNEFGRVALVSTRAAVGTNYTRSDVVDLVGYGSTTPSFEGVGPAGTLSNLTVDARKLGGCQDSNQNAIDFDLLLALSQPHNSASPPNLCPIVPHCGTADFNCDGDLGTDADIESFFACLAGACPAAPCTNSADFNGDGDIGTDSDIEAFFRVLSGGNC